MIAPCSPPLLPSTPPSQVSMADTVVMSSTPEAVKFPVHPVLKGGGEEEGRKEPLCGGNGAEASAEHPLKNRKDGYAYHCEGFHEN